MKRREVRHFWHPAPLHVTKQCSLIGGRLRGYLFLVAWPLLHGFIYLKHLLIILLIIMVMLYHFALLGTTPMNKTIDATPAPLAAPFLRAEQFSSN